MTDIVVTALNARYHHASFGARYLMANLAELQPRAQLLEFTIQQAPLDVVETLLAAEPRIVGLGLYIWNVIETTRVVHLLRQLAPQVVLVLGGPEVTGVLDDLPVAHLVDYVLPGEADLAFAELCRQILARPIAEQRPATTVFLPTALPKLDAVASPYAHYSAIDLAERVLYVEASRGCPFTCEFCLSALDIPVRQFPLEPFLSDLESLLNRGARQFKFVDRTFNLNVRVSQAILEYFLRRPEPDLFLHFEMIPDRLPSALRAVIAQFPPGCLQFEVGIQTFNSETSELISRRQDLIALEDNLRWLRINTGVHIHADLIVGLPGEGWESFAAGFDRLVALAPHEIQVGLLKRLRGTPIARHDAEWQMIYSHEPPHELVQNRLLTFTQIQELRRFAKTWDMLANSGNFRETAPYVWGDQSPFAGVLEFSRWLLAGAGRTHGISLTHLVEYVFRFLVERCNQAPADIAPLLWRDYTRSGRSDTPACLRPHLNGNDSNRNDGVVPMLPSKRLPQRQARHWAD